jgi:hypothetical protein
MPVGQSRVARTVWRRRQRRDTAFAPLPGWTRTASPTTVSAIEADGVSTAEVATLAKYVETLGGRLRIVAQFDDEELILR